jgi:putative ATPase
MNIPLAERMRPKSLDEYIGQEHLIGPQATLRKALDHGRIPSMILWGPPGVGKTTLAHLIANHLKRTFFALSAINSGVKDVRETIAKAENQKFFSQASPILFIDEIHRFSKSQQDSLLGAVEKGTITLIGATTENPSFEVISALLSRCQVYVLKPLEIDHLKAIIQRTTLQDELFSKMNITIEEYESIIKYSGGDARRLLNVLEILISQFDEGAEIKIDNILVEKTLQREILKYDKSGEAHYDTISAFIKSVRGSDPDAAIYYLARMIEGGEDPKFIARRLIILASEDIGLANPNALLLANACFDAVQKIGFPEGRIPLAQCTIYLAQSPKSNSAYMAIEKALSVVRQTGELSIPLELRNAPTKLMKELGYGDGYLYPHNYENSQVDFNYLPDEIQGQTFYVSKSAGSENKGRT